MGRRRHRGQLQKDVHWSTFNRQLSNLQRYRNIAYMQYREAAFDDFLGVLLEAL